MNGPDSLWLQEDSCPCHLCTGFPAIWQAPAPQQSSPVQLLSANEASTWNATLEISVLREATCRHLCCYPCYPYHPSNQHPICNKWHLAKHARRMPAAILLPYQDPSRKPWGPEHCCCHCFQCEQFRHMSLAEAKCSCVRLLAQVAILLLSLPPPPLLLSHNVITPLLPPPLLLLQQLYCCSDQLQDSHFRAVTTAQLCLWLHACVSALAVTIALCIKQQDTHSPRHGFSCSS